MASRISLSLARLINTTSITSSYPSSTPNATALALAECFDIDGNQDLYGLGIRIGVYLQWFSSYLSVLADPLTAQDTHDANSVFLFAMIIATVIAALERRLYPVEGYIMLQFSMGFLSTVLTLVGVRIQLLTAKGVAGLAAHIRALPNDLRESMIAQKFFSGRLRRTGDAASIRSLHSRRSTRFIHLFSRTAETRQETRRTLLQKIFRAFRRLQIYLFMMPMAAFSFFKLPFLSWSGVLFRTAIGGIVCGFNVWFWFAGLEYMAQGQPCDTRVFMFGLATLTGRLLKFYKVIAVILLLPSGLTAIYLGVISLRLIIFFVVCLYRELGYRTVTSIEPAAKEKIQRTLQAVEAVMQPVEGLASAQGHTKATTLAGFVAPEFWATPLRDIPRASDLIKVLAALLGSGVEDEPSSKGPAAAAAAAAAAADAAKKREVRAIHWWVAGGWNVVVLLMMVWFIVSIEMTITWNAVQGTNEINSTGQLIPFVIGVVSCAQAIKRALIVAIKRAYPDWAQTKLEISQDLFGDLRFRIEKTDTGLTSHDTRRRLSLDEKRPATTIV